MIADVFTALELIESTSSRNEKEYYIRALDAADQYVCKLLFEATFHPYRTYGVVVRSHDLVRNSTTYDTNRGFIEFVELTNQLARRELTGNAARDTVSRFLGSISEVEAKWYRRILNRDLRCGLSYATAHKLFPGLVPRFKVQLCSKYYGAPFDTEFWVETKLDGHRCLLIPTEAGFVARSRSGKEMYNVDHVIREFDSAPACRDYVFDGEMISSHADFNTTSSILRTESMHDLGASIKYNVFDCIPITEWVEQRCTRCLRTRKFQLINLTRDFTETQVLSHQSVHSADEAFLVSKSHLEAGYEGGILKDPDSKYDYDRTESWRKIKFMDTEDYPIVGAAEGTGKYMGRLGALLIDVGGTVVGVGTGYSDFQRQEIWTQHQRGELRDAAAEVSYQNQTPDGSLRFPVFVRLRFDK